MNNYAMLAGFLGTGVEFVEALTIILAVGLVRGWKSALAGTGVAVAVLVALVALVGAPLVSLIQIFWVQLLVGLFMLLFGIRWLRKAILRYAGLKALHDEAESFQQELERQKAAGEVGVRGIQPFAFMTTFSITMLEGLEAIFIVITFGLSSHAMNATITGAVVAAVLVVLAGIVLRQPMAKVPENTMKFIVGLMLTSFGAFWIGEGFHVAWPQADVSILYMTATLAIFSWLIVKRCKSKLSSTRSNSKSSYPSAEVQQ